jgi:hypothetical protein
MKNRINHLEALEAGLKGIEHLRRAQPGTGPMEIRREERVKAQELILKFLEINIWPKRYLETKEMIMNTLCELV